ncbi:DUF2207 domain-containing protein [Arsenicicoccus sp. oral taxon 190]|uniref:DUF2207 domain-containing protein n=1 Tax=Arsenicicoccus sp. oral taxon 190 TaxID=1658671 RepID=UPI00067A3BC8|nr:DUF2207 domain-containing protein [Arsenicicoccus sp. oral taxon 190]AKT51462.1 hypothetical protein ADJ73_09285 [Arsenicicoccus sp. oral taxon 190]
MTTDPRPHLRTARALAVLAVTLWLMLLGLAPAGAASGGDRVTRLVVDYVLDAQGGVSVTETYDYRFTTSGRHGMERTIATAQGYTPTEDNPAGSDGSSGATSQERHYEISDISASSPSGAPAQLSVRDQGDATVLRVGSPSRTVQGDQQYVLKYHLAHVVNEQPSDVEFYYNVLGNSWRVPFDAVEVTVRGPGSAAVTKAACYYGAFKSSEKCEATPGNPARFSARDLAVMQNMSVVAALPRSAFTDVSKDVRDAGSAGSGGPYISPESARVRTLSQLGIGVGAPLLALAGMGALVWRRGRDERYVGLAPDTLPAPGQQVATRRGGKAPVTAVRFNPPDDATPGLIGTIYDESADTIDVSATVIDLAVRGYLRIEQTQDAGVFQTSDWKLEYLGTPKPGDRGLLTYERTVLDGIFSLGTPVMMSELKNHFAGTLAIAKQEMYAETVRRGWFRQSPERVRQGFGCLTWLPFALIFAWMFFGAGSFAGALASDGVAGFDLPVPSLMVAAAGLLSVPFIMRWLVKKLPARTADGSAVLEQTKGFREYLLTAEAEQIKYDEALDIFSRYLPYAVVFGVADRWARIFARVAEMARADGYDVGVPTFYVWYGGGFGGFGDFGHAVDSFSSSAAGTFTSTPGSSGGSGFGGGGFGGGGGFSGGGVGDGGGGSW